MITTMKLITKKRKRVGRGYGSGKGGHTVGRGQKGKKLEGRLEFYLKVLRLENQR